jgi:general secretion pathway protein A
MYQQYYGFKELPFELTPNPRYLYLPRQHREALSTLEYGLSSGKPVTALIGEAGTGKTTLVNAALASERCRNVRCVYLVNPTLTRQEFVESLSVRFGLSARAAASKATFLEELERVLRERCTRNQMTALVIDEAQSLTDELLEEVRLLANSETMTDKLLAVVLAGQSELTHRLNESGLRQLKQRVALRCEIGPFTLQETAAYIAHRVRVAGGDATRIFSREAIMLIHDRSGGIARTISVICDNALLTTFALSRHRVDSDIVLEVAHDFDLGGVRMLDPSLQGGPVALGDGDSEEGEDSARPGAEDVQSLDADASPAGVGVTAVGDERSLFAEPRASRRFSLFGRR